MACRRSISTTRILLARRLSYARIYHHSHHDHGVDADTLRSSPTPPPSRSPAYSTDFSQRRASYGTVTRAGPLQFSRERRCLLLSAASSPGIGMWLPPSLSSRSLSTAVGGESSVSDDVFLADVVTTDLAAQAAPAVVSEVAAAAADSAYPVAALQHLIDGMHSFTGLNWWASIALTTILIRGATIPLLINQLKSTSKLSIMRPRLEELNQKFRESATEPDAVAKYNQRVMALFKEKRNGKMI